VVAGADAEAPLRDVLAAALEANERHYVSTPAWQPSEQSPAGCPDDNPGRE
jgi:hypothetical protein